MHILHIETSTKVCSVALSHGSSLISYRELDEEMNHAAALAPMIDELMRRSGVSMKDLEAVSVSSGPGSYTGLRVGGSTSKAIAYSLGIPIIPVPTLLSLASAGLESNGGVSLVCPMMDARRNEVYTALFDRHLKAVWPDASVVLDEDFTFTLSSLEGKVLFVGDGAVKLKVPDSLNQKLIVDDSIRCSARYLVKPAFEFFQIHQTADPLHFVPFYLKPPNITQSKKAV